MEGEIKEAKKKEDIETMDMSVLENVIGLLENKLGSVERYNESEDCVFIRIDGGNVIKVSVGESYTNFFARDKKVQFKHGSSTNTDENIISKVKSIFGKGDFAVIIGGVLATEKLSGVFNTEFIQTSERGEQYFRCIEPSILGVKTLQIGLNLTSIRKIGFPDFSPPKTFENGNDVDDYFDSVKSNAQGNAEATHKILELLNKIYE